MSLRAQVNAAHVDSGTGQVIIDELIKHHTYDGLGRQIRTQSPYPDPSAGSGDVRTERFFYDGVRRIQELVTDPVIATRPAAASSDPELQLLAAESNPPGSNLDQSTASMTLAFLIFLRRAY